MSSKTPRVGLRRQQRYVVDVEVDDGDFALKDVDVPLRLVLLYKEQ
jgi:hypothetical protein